MDKPLSYPPKGVIPNIANPPYLGRPVLVTAGVFLPLIVIFAFIRIYAKGFILRKWKLDDYVFFLTCPIGIAMIAFAIALVGHGANGYHAWDVMKKEMTKTSIVETLVFSMALGPVLWLLKLSLFCTILKAFGPVKWLKNCVYVGIISTGMFYAAYTIVFAVSCGPEGSGDLESYINGLTRKQCYSPKGANAVASIMMGAVNFLSDVYLLILPLPVVKTLKISKRQKFGVYFIIGSGGFMCVCSLLGLIFRIQSWKSKDITGSQIRLYVLFIVELALGLIIPCKPSLFTLYRHWTSPSIADTFISKPKDMQGFTVLASPTTETPGTWKKQHMSIQEIPYSKPSSEYSRNAVEDLRMKALPATPFPVHPKSPQSPSSVRSMSLPIMFHPVR